MADEQVKPQEPDSSEDQNEEEKKKDGEDLSTILSTSQQANLTLLIAHITASMRQLLLQNFDATASLDKSLFGVDRSKMTEDEKLMAADPSKADADEYEKQRKLKAEYEKDLNSLKMKNLKKNSLKAFDEWREQVILRIGEVVNSQESARKQLQRSKSSFEGRAKPDAPATSIGRISENPDKGSKLKFKDLYPPTKTELTKLSMDKRTLLLHSLLLLLLSLEHYSAPSRVLLLLFTSSLKLPLKTFEQDEYVTAKGLLEGVKELSAKQETKKKIEENKENRKWRVGLATAAGAAIFGISGSLAAPLVAAGVGSVMGGIGLGATSAATYLGTVAGSTYLIGGMFGAYGGRMTGQMMDNYAREVEDFEFLPVHSNKKTSEDEEQGAKEASDNDHKLRVTICISGWLTEKEEVVKPWAVLGTGAEVFALKYELEALLNLGNAMNGLVESAAWGYAQKQLIAQTIFADLAGAMWPVALIKAARVVDNPFNVAKSRSEKAGEVLADALINKAQGERPVTLIGYSLGAKVIYNCLMSLAKRKAFGLVENAVLFGAPTPSDTSDWRMLRSAVTGRLINVYSENDYVLGFVYRTSSLQYGVAGLQAVRGIPSVENVNVSEEVTGHLKYRFLIGSILKKIGFEDINMQAVEEEQEALKKMEEEEKKNSLNAQRKTMMSRKSNGGKANEEAEADQEATEIEKKVQEKTQKSLVTRAIEYFSVPNLPSGKDREKMVGNIQKAARDPSQVGELISESAKDAQSMAQRVYQALPSMPYLARDKKAGKSTEGEVAKASEQVQETVKSATVSTQSYTARAAEYLPAMPKNLPSMPKNLPSMPRSLPSMPKSLPSMPSIGRSKATPKTQPEQATDSVTDVGKKATDSLTDGGKKAAETADELVRPTLENATNLKDNPAVNAIKNTTKQAPIIHQAVKPAEESAAGEKAKDVAAAATTTVDNATSTTGGAGEAVLTKAASIGKAAGKYSSDGAQSAGKVVASPLSKGESKTEDKGKKAQNNTQSYTGYAASYLPSIPTWGGGKKASPKSDQKPSADSKSPPQPPKLERRGTSQRGQEKDKDAAESKPQPPKLERRGTSQKLDKKDEKGVRSPPPKLGSRQASGIKSPAPKPIRMPSEVKKLAGN